MTECNGVEMALAGSQCEQFLSLYPTVTGRMSSWAMKALPRMIGSHSL